VTLGVVNDLGVNVLEAAVHRQPRPFGRALDLLAQTEMAPLAALRTCQFRHIPIPPASPVADISRTLCRPCRPYDARARPRNGCPCPNTAPPAGRGGFGRRTRRQAPCRCPAR